MSSQYILVYVKIVSLLKYFWINLVLSLSYIVSIIRNKNNISYILLLYYILLFIYIYYLAHSWVLYKLGFYYLINILNQNFLFIILFRCPSIFIKFFICQPESRRHLKKNWLPRIGLHTIHQWLMMMATILNSPSR